MSAKSKLQLILELKNKLFNNKLTATKRKFKATTKGMENNVSRLKMKTVRGFKAMTSEVPLFGRALSLLGNPYTLIAAGLVATIGLFGTAALRTKEFNHEFLQVKQLNLDKNIKQLDAYKGLIRDSAFETGKNLNESTKAYYDIQSALGFYGKKADTVFKQVAKFSTATGAELNDSINATSKAIKAFGLGAKDTKMLLESNAKTVQVGITTFKELAKVQTDYAGAAAGAGQKVDTANKLFAAFTSIAKSGTEAATMTKTALMGLTQSSTIKGFKSIGVEMYDINGKMRDVDGILREVSGKFKTMSPKAIDEIINKIGGTEGLRALLTKVKTGADDMFKTFDAFDASQFDLDKALKNAMGDVTVLGGIVKNRFNTVMARLGEKILPTVARALEGMNKFITWVYNNFGLLEDIIESVGIGLLAGVAYLGYFKIAAIASTISSIGLSGAIGLVNLGLHAMKAAILSIPIVGWIIAAVTALVLLYKKWDFFRASVDALGAVFKSFFVNLWDGFKSVISGIIDGFKAIFKIAGGLKNLDFSQMKEGAADFMTAQSKTTAAVIKMSGVNHIKQATAKGLNAYSKVMHKSKGKEEDNNLLGEDAGANGNGLGTGDGSGLGKQLTTVTGKASQPRSITVNIDALNKGGINTQNTTLANMNAEDIEAWFNEAMLRIIRNVELSGN